MKKYLLFLLFGLCTGCVQEIDIYGGYEYEKKIVFDGVLSNEEPPYYFRLTESAPFSDSDVKGITDALIVISDSQGVKDTLQSMETGEGPSEPDYLGYPGYPENPSEREYFGVYQTTKIKGKEGETYHLQIAYNDRIYEATETMPFVTRIDSVWFAEKYLEGKKETVACPYVNFVNRPEENNYWLFTYKSYNSPDSLDRLYELVEPQNRLWQFSILKDSYLPEKIESFNLNDGEAPFGTEEGLFFHFSDRDSCTIILYTITNSTYSFYDDLIKQMRYDGGAFTPAPASARSNISNGALGVFRVSSVHKKKTLPVMRNRHFVVETMKCR